jgi:ABC-type polar amino acid transport system ATPase subunit
MIKINSLFKSFGNLSVLENVSTDIKKGEVISVIGPSGCGKSTFMRCINLLERPTQGEILIDGQNIRAGNADVCLLRRKMGMVFQSFILFSHLMIIENVMLGPVSLLKMPWRQGFTTGNTEGRKR